MHIALQKLFKLFGWEGLQRYLELRAKASTHSLTPEESAEFKQLALKQLQSDGFDTTNQQKH